MAETVTFSRTDTAATITVGPSVPYALHRVVGLYASADQRGGDLTIPGREGREKRRRVRDVITGGVVIDVGAGSRDRSGRFLRSLVEHVTPDGDGDVVVRHEMGSGEIREAVAHVVPLDPTGRGPTIFRVALDIEIPSGRWTTVRKPTTTTWAVLRQTRPTVGDWQGVAFEEIMGLDR